MIITNERNHNSELGFDVYKSNGEYVIHDMTGYKSYKTLKALNRRVAKMCSMRGIAAIEITE